MSSIPARRILSSAARPYLRSKNGVCNVHAPSVISQRAAFSMNSHGASIADVPSTTRQQELRQWQRRQVFASAGNVLARNAVRWSTTSATGSKIWSFEEIKSLASQDSETPTLIDVREPSELASTGRIPGAVNIPITTSPDSFHITPEEFEDRFGFSRPEKDDEVVFYCKAGVRSRAAAGIAREAGWKDVGEFPGSWVEWTAKGGDVER
ncbi:Rhodanese-like domain-containing protein [Xylaria venustula]|nr:Rhodanese-like domain-containing protein [Xylaria venustula]